MHVLQFTPLFFWKTYCERRQKDTFHICRELKVWGLLNVNWIGVVYVWKFVCVAENLDTFPKVHTFTTQKLTNLYQNNTESHHFYKKSSVRKCHRRSQDILASFCCWFEVAEGDLILFWVIVWLCECEIFWVWGPTFRLTQLPIN